MFRPRFSPCVEIIGLDVDNIETQHTFEHA